MKNDSESTSAASVGVVDVSMDVSTVKRGRPSLKGEIESLKQTIEAKDKVIEAQAERLKHSVEMELQYQPVIDGPPYDKTILWNQACSNDAATSETWRDTWLNHIRINEEKFNCSEHSVGALVDTGKYNYHPAICAGSGPSLKKNVEVLAKYKTDAIPLVSCLHNFSFFKANGVKTDYWLTLDAGDVTISEVFDGGAEVDWSKTKGETLVASVVANPKLMEKWQGEILWYNSIIPDQVYMQEMPKLTKVRYAYSVGGTTLGACFYHAIAILGCMPIAMIGADFSFGYTKKFHAWDSQYDQQYSGLIRCTDIFGNMVKSWQSYTNFAAWFQYQAMGGKSNFPCLIYNCTEGGILGAFPTGNMKQIPQMRLREFFESYTRHTKYKEGVEKTDAFAFLF